MTPEDRFGMSEAELLAAVFEGSDPFERGSSFEPSLLAHLARLCHHWSIRDVARAALDFDWRSSPLGSVDLVETTLNQLAVRFDDAALEAAWWGVDTAELGVRRLVAQGGDVDAWWDAAGDRVDLQARLAAIEPTIERVEAIVDALPSTDVHPESARALLSAANALGVAVDTPWAANVVEIASSDPVWAAHVLPALAPGSERAAVADRVIETINAAGLPEWAMALYISRVTAYGSGWVEWDLSRFDVHGNDVWGSFLRELSERGAVGSPDDTLRAHPFAEELAMVREPHELTTGYADAITGTWGSPPEAMESAAPDDGSDGAPHDAPDGGTEPNPPRLDALAAGGSAPTSDAPPPEPTTAPTDTEALSPTTEHDVDDRHLGIDFLTESGHLLDRAVVAGQVTDLEVSIAPPGVASAGVPAGLPFPDGVDRISLLVRLVCDGVDEEQELKVRRDPHSSASVTFQVTPTADQLSGLIVVYNEDRSAIVRGASFSVAVAPTLEDAAEAPPSITLHSVDTAALSTLARSSSGTIATNGVQTIPSTAEVRLPVAVNTVFGHLQGVLPAIELGAQDYAATNGRTTIDAALLRAAQSGFNVRIDMNLDKLADCDHIQMVSLTGQTVFPIDLVYGGPAPDEDAAACTHWFEARDASVQPSDRGSCPQCDALSDDDQRRIVCPSRFWGISKVIEHVRITDLPGAQFAARVQPLDRDPRLPTPKASLVSASASVFKGSADAKEQAKKSVVDAFGASAAAIGPVSVVDDWPHWREAIAAIRATPPDLLIAMPHQERRRVDGAILRGLELGGTTVTTFDEAYFRQPGNPVGPVVIMLGCNIAVSDHMLSFAEKFRNWAPVVIATLGEIIADEAQLIVATLLREISAADDAGDFPALGEGVRRARIDLLRQHRLAGLQLVFCGDASWAFASPKRVRHRAPRTGDVMIRVEMLAAERGDALLIEYGTAAAGMHRVLIDGGPVNSGNYDALRERLRVIERAPDGRRYFDLLIITHVDTDHIEGVIRLLQDTELRCVFDDIWFNGWKHLVALDAGREVEVLGGQQGEFLGALLTRQGRPWNQLFRGGPIVVPDPADDDAPPLPTVTLRGGLVLTLLSPTFDKLTALGPKWREHVEQAGFVAGNSDQAYEKLSNKWWAKPPETLGNGDVDASDDNSEANGSSIAVLAEFEGRSVLLSGDAHDDTLTTTLRRLRSERAVDAPLHIDALKLSHHGSSNNTTPQLLAEVRADDYLVSSSGDRYDHPDAPTIRLIVDTHLQDSPPTTPVVRFNYRSNRTVIWEDHDGLTAMYGPDAVVEYLP